MSRRPRMLDGFCCQGGMSDWMTKAGLSQAIPPAMAQYVGEQLLASMGSEAVA